MGIAESLKRNRIDDREIEGVGTVRIRHLRAREMLELGKVPDKEAAGRALIAACVVDENSAPVFATADEVNEVDGNIVKALSEAVVAVNQLNAKDAEKNLPTPPPSA